MPTRISLIDGSRLAELMIDYRLGVQHWLWDGFSGYPPRSVQGFYTRDELELMIQRRHTRLPLAREAVTTAIAGRPWHDRHDPARREGSRPPGGRGLNGPEDPVESLRGRVDVLEHRHVRGVGDADGSGVEPGGH